MAGREGSLWCQDRGVPLDEPTQPDRVRYELVVTYVFAAVMASTGLATPLYPGYRERLDLSSLDVTAVYGVYAVVVLLTLLVAGGLSDQVGRRPVLALAVLAAGVGEAVLLVFPTLPGLYAGRSVTGVAAGLVLGCATAYLADLAGKRHARRASTLAVLANLGGQAAGTAGSGLVSQLMPAPLATPYVLALVALLPAAALLRTPDPAGAAGTWRAGLRLRPPTVPGQVRTLFFSTAAALVAAFSLLGFLTALTGSVLDQRLARPGALLAGLTVAALFTTAALAQLAVPARLFTRASALALGLLPVAAALLSLAALLASTAALVAAVLLTGAVVGVILRAGIGSVLAVCPPAVHGRVGSALFVAVYLGASLPTIAAGVLATEVSLTAAVVVLCAFVVVTAAGAGLVRAVARR